MPSLLLLIQILPALFGELVTISNPPEARRDANGQLMDIHDGNLQRYNASGRFWWLGMGYRNCTEVSGLLPPQQCPGIYQRSGEGCGFRNDHAVNLYSSADLITWRFEANLREATWPQGIYYRPKVVRDPSSGRFILWINFLPPGAGKTPLAEYPNATYLVFTAQHPRGPFLSAAAAAQPPVVSVSGGGDFALFVDDDGTGYVAYDAWGNGHTVTVERLAPGLTRAAIPTQSSGAVSASGFEAPVLFKRRGVYYLIFGKTCCFCKGGAGAHVYTSTASPLGPWNNTGVDLNPVVVGLKQRALPTQNNFIFAANATTFVFMGDAWGSAPDRLKSHDAQIWSPLAFDDSVSPPRIIAPLRRLASFTVDILPATTSSNRPFTVARSTIKLSSARRNIGATVANVNHTRTAYFAGGCSDQGGTSHERFVCTRASATVDVLTLAADGSVRALPLLKLGQARGWVAAGAVGGSVVFAGGGTSGPGRHFRGADVLDLASNTMSVVEAALKAEPLGRWGISVAALNSSLYFLGGKVEVDGYSNAYMSSGIDVFDGDAKTFTPAQFNLSQARESTSAVSTGGTMIVAGGWRNSPRGSNRTDLFTEITGGGASATNTPFDLDSDAFAVGVSAVGDAAYIVGNQELLIVGKGGQAHSSKLKLPAELILPPGDPNDPAMNCGSAICGTIPSAHVVSNGASVLNRLACFVSVRNAKTECATSLACFDALKQTWLPLQPCSVNHDGGTIVALSNSTILIAGGFDPSLEGNTTATAVVDVFRFSHS